jgi:hypothetical protein
MPYGDETRIILQKMLDMLSEEGFLVPELHRELEHLVTEEGMSDESAIASLLDKLAKEVRA